MWSTFHIWSYFLTLTSVLVVVSSGLQNRDQCTSVRPAYSNLGYPSIDVPRRSRLGRDLQICSEGFTCCTEEMEDNLYKHSQDEFDKRLADATEFTRTTFMTATAKFNAFFLNLVEVGQTELDVMFTSAYGLQYKQNEDVFNQLFADFQAYYKGGDISLNEAMGKFFYDVFVRMFVMQSVEYEFDSAYLRCVGDKMDTLKPFGTTPVTLTKSIRQAFVAARTFIQGLVVGRNVALKMAQVQPTKSCSQAYTKQSYCSVCQAMGGILPCKEYCLNVMQGCLAYHAEVHTSWSKYIDAMLALAERLEGAGSFNIEVAITPLKDLISSAIMDYHSNSQKIRDEVFSLNMCGQPPPAGQRSKRGTRNRPRQRAQLPPSLANKRGTLNVLVNEIKSKISQIRSIWSDLPMILCDGSVTAVSGSSECWTGDDQARYTKAEYGSGLSANVHNPEVKVAQDAPNPIILAQIRELDEAARHLSNAKLGIDVDWLDLNITDIPVPATDVQSGSSDARIPTRQTPGSDDSTEPDFNIEQSGSGDLDTDKPGVAPLESVDTETGDVEEVVSSGWTSDIVRITPPVKNPKPHRQNGGGDRDSGEDVQVEGSGVSYDLNKPIAIPILPSDRDRPVRPFDINRPIQPSERDRIYPEKLEGSGILFILTADDDDEDHYIPIKNTAAGSNVPSETNVIQAGDVVNNLLAATTPPLSAANTNSINILTLVTLAISIILSLHDAVS